MAEEGAAKLRLKARKAPTACGRERQASTDRSSWFEKNDLNEREKTWSLLLRNISQDLQCTSWQTVPHFPEFFRKSSEEESLQNQEVFKVGMKDFHWTSFPAFHREQNFKPEDLSSPQVIETQTEHLHEEWDQEDELKSLPSTSEQRCCKTNTDPKNMAWEDTRGSSKADVDLKPSKDTQHKTSTYYLASSQGAVKAPSIQQHCRGTVQNSKENREQEKRELQAQMHQSSTSLGETRSVPAERKPPLGSMAGNESCKENSGHQSEGSSTLDSCPMCLIRFSETLSQLDIDGHLARCLSESTDDIVW